MKRYYIPSILLLLVSFVFNFAQAQLPDSWWPRTDYLGIVRAAASSFAIDGKGYVGLGYNFSVAETVQKDFWTYDQLSNSWTQIADFGGLARSGASGCAAGGKGYIIAGYADSLKNDIWEYDPALNSWTEKAPLPAIGRHYANALNIGNKVYFGSGEFSDFWEFDPSANSWTRKADMPGLPRSSASAFSIGNTGYIGTGYIAQGVNSFWAYDTTSNT